MKLLKLGERKVAEAHRQALRPLRTGAWQRSDSHERPPQNFAFTQLLRSTPTFPPQHPSPHLLLAFPSLKLLIDSFTPANALAHLGQTSTAKADFLIICEVHLSAHCPSLVCVGKR